MKYSKVALTILCSTLMTACASLEATVAPTQEYKGILDSRASALQQLGTATVCCSSINELQYQPLAAEQKRVVAIDGSSPAFNFPEGKSYYAAFKLPSNSGDLKITVAGLIDKTLFNPTVLLLDSQFKPTRTIGANIITYKPARMLDGDRVEGVFTIDRSYVGNPNNETYMVIYTTQATLSQTTQAMSPSKMMAKSMSVQDYGAKDPLIPHSAWGVVTLDVEDLSASALGDNFYKPVYQEAIDANTPIVDTTPNKLVVPVATAATAATAATSVAGATVAKPAPAMLSETEAFYQSQIEKAVKAGDIDKAMKLVNEAERAGSTKAKSVFIDAVKRSQK
ncbi:MalM family protein [Aeromonas veronii]|uniref:MalM family protein n=1 Tax=Aeromonas veronii TaxID=654 RepID=UPI00187E5F44|nr:MalM family protein [Aeromonas veronii]MBE8733549.1 transcriptional regulator [Aeromonas veronii]MBE8737647.1 transcriptional regulator [Aeromonas veronii]MBE8742300.1 transcriptional regulator [Aeromonas veronii]MBE8765256.1 transcriptional regulator [Aeromonas veronii]MBE8839728.1 transcriptional regulator [Aeromonas veronii]